MLDNRPEPLFYSKDQAILKYGLNGSSLKLSSLSEFYRPVESTGLAIKFVAEGNERYTIDKQTYLVPAGSYLLLNGEKDATVAIDSKKNVKGICIHISNAVIADVFASHIRPDTAFTDPDLASFLCSDNFLENQYQSNHTLLGGKLQEISRDVQQKTLSAEDINDGLFFELAEQLIADQAMVFKQLHALPTVKAATKRDLCRRLIHGREFIDSHFALPLTIEDIARESAMSEYHFFRLFKSVFGVSPYQYITGRRMQAACLLLKAERPVSDVAMDCGYADIFTFSKAFKKHFGVTPSSFSHEK